MIYKKRLCTLAVVLFVWILLLNTHYISQSDASGKWKMVCYKSLLDNPHGEWDCILYYYGLDAPESILVKRTENGMESEGFYESKRFGIMDSTCGNILNFSRIFLDRLAFTMPATGGYSFLVTVDRPKDIKAELKWDGGNTEIVLKD